MSVESSLSRTFDSGTATDAEGEAIDRAARDIATSVGLTSITLRRMVSSSGLTPAAVAAREPSMSALAARTFSDLAAAELDRISTELGTASTPLEGVQKLVVSLQGSEHDISKTVWADAWSVGRHNDRVAAAARTSMTAWQGLLVELIVAGVDAGMFQPCEPELVARQFFALVDSTTAYALVGYLDAEARAALVSRGLEVALGVPTGTF
ncbi:TetR family transcriptional regulator C-terminal domain-containing protein [Frondihabitans cladoniiphilus]|uniref:BetI-type transcriptional repressor C-terminal domain-containing protein n=1 Tax=Frondihabitans cladoniiphilus TaxID=715785 RepID=A0ABP8VKK2_9MICO